VAQIVLGIGTSHSPLLLLGADDWALRSADDRRSRGLNTLDGRLLSYDALAAERGEPYAAQSNPALFPALAQRAEQALDRLADALTAARPDLLLVVGDDQGELFGQENMPAVSVFCGEELVMRPAEHLEHAPPWATSDFWAGYRMDLPHRYPGAPAVAEDLIRGLIRQGVDVTAVRHVVDPAQRGFGHAFGFIIERLAREGAVPMLPVLLNTYFPPNTPTSARCFEIGTKIAAALAASPSAARVAVIASGGLSHFLCEEAFDRRVLAALRSRDIDTLAQIPQEALLSGSSEIRNWITVAGMVGHLELDFMEYIPVRRTPLGTGIGLAFVTWGAGQARADRQIRSALQITEEQA
jgi:Catalytic LigB subunit of aromatic ring-opening dioxygenase